MARRSALRRLGDRAGILSAYRPMGGGRVCRTSDATREALLAAMGFEASDERAAARALRALDDAEAARWLAPLGVERVGSAAARRLPLRAPAGRIDWRIELREEGGRRHGLEGRTRGGGLRSLPLPPDLPTGYHELHVMLDAPDGAREAEQRLVIAPARCFGVADALAGGSGYGLLANLYALRRAGDWGAGDLGHLRELARLAAAGGADFVGLNPLHALIGRWPDVSPYSPLSRLYRAELYLEVEAVPELADCPDAAARLGSPELAAVLRGLRERRAIDYDGVGEAKRGVLELLHRHFAARHRGSDTPRGVAYAAYLAREGAALDDFATFVALSEWQSARGAARDWRAWPAPLRDPRSPAVARFRAEHAERVDYQRWVQFELDRQLAEVADGARSAGLSIGLYGDLAVGASGAGSDAWAFPGLFAHGASVGAPPDDFAREGQDWALPPMIPHALAERRFEDWTRLLRAGFAHAGALRIDHVMGLFRLFWIPAPGRASEGAYVRYPARELLAILALESQRHRALVVGEDLGTVPPGLAARLARAGILSSRVLYFERRGRGFRPARRWSRRALATANTHDLAPLAGYFSGRDLELRRAAGAIRDDAALAEARRERAAACRALLRRLVREGLLAAGDVEDPDALPYPRLAAAVAAFLARTPSPLVGFAVDDLAAEPEPVNLPGVPLGRYPSWSRRLSVGLEDLPDQPAFRAVLAVLAGSGRGSGAQA